MVLLCLAVVAAIGATIWLWPAASPDKAARNRAAGQAIPVVGPEDPLVVANQARQAKRYFDPGMTASGAVEILLICLLDATISAAASGFIVLSLTHRFPGFNGCKCRRRLLAPLFGGRGAKDKL